MYYMDAASLFPVAYNVQIFRIFSEIVNFIEYFNFTPKFRVQPLIIINKYLMKMWRLVSLEPVPWLRGKLKLFKNIGDTTDYHQFYVVYFFHNDCAEKYLIK